MKTNRLTLLALLTFAGAVPAFSQITFSPTGAEMIPTSMSDDASIVVGTGFYGTPNLYYTAAAGVTVIGDGCSNGLPAISGDGTTVVACHVDADGNENAAKWLGGTNWLDLGSEAGAVPCGTSLSGGYGVNEDGSVAVGLLWRSYECRASAGIWDLLNGGPAKVLRQLLVRPSSRANAVNGNGRVVVGWQDQISGVRSAAKWVDNQPEFILTASGGYNGEAMAVSRDGGTIVGGGYDFGNNAWIWQASTGVQPIGMSTGMGNRGAFTALSVSDKGQMVVGFERQGRTERAFIWTAGGRTDFLDHFLASRGVDVPAGWSLAAASLISSDGNTIYGWGFNPDGQLETFKVNFAAATASPRQ